MTHPTHYHDPVAEAQAILMILTATQLFFVAKLHCYVRDHPLPSLTSQKQNAQTP